MPATLKPAKISSAKIRTRQQEFDYKLAQIRTYLNEHGLSQVAINSQMLFNWATAGGENYVVMAHDFGVAWLLISPDNVAVIANNIEINRLRVEEFHGIDTGGFEFWSCPWHEDAQISKEIARRAGGKRWISDSHLPGSEPVGGEFMALTYVLTPTELDRYRKLGKDCSVAMEESLEPVRPGMNEMQVAANICARLFDRGIRPNLALVASDDRVFQHRHPIPVDKKIKKHMMAVLCGKRSGMIINVTRMVHFAKKLPDDLRRKHDAVCAVDIALNTATIPGRPMNEVFEAGLAEYRKQGFADEWKLHHQGGPTGYQGRSFRGMPSETRKVLSNQAFAWNPSITGTKSEDTIFVTDEGLEFLSSPTRKWPQVTVKAAGKTWKRGDILLK
jgi:Xaa-Pro aminopeptidase